MAGGDDVMARRAGDRAAAGRGRLIGARDARPGTAMGGRKRDAEEWDGDGRGILISVWDGRDP